MEAWPEQVITALIQFSNLRFSISVTSSACYTALASAPEQGWQLATPLAINVSHAAAASLGDNLFVFGGQQACDDNNKVKYEI